MVLVERRPDVSCRVYACIVMRAYGRRISTLAPVTMLARTLRDLLMHLATRDLFSARCSHRVHDEWIAALPRNRRDLTPEQLVHAGGLRLEPAAGAAGTASSPEPARNRSVFSGHVYVRSVIRGYARLSRSAGRRTVRVNVVPHCMQAWITSSRSSDALTSSGPQAGTTVVISIRFPQCWHGSRKLGRRDRLVPVPCMTTTLRPPAPNREPPLAPTSLALAK